MAAAKKPETRLAVIVETPAGDRAVFTVPVREADPEAAVLRAESIRRKNADETGYPVRIDTFTHAA